MATAAQKNQERIREIVKAMLGELATGDLRVDFARAELLAEEGIGQQAWKEVVRLAPIAKFPENQLPPSRISGAVDEPLFWEQQTNAVREHLETKDRDIQRREMLDRAGERDYLERVFGDGGETSGPTPSLAPATGDPLEARAGAGAFDDAPTTSGGQTSAGSQGSGAAGGGAASPAPSTGGAAPSTTTGSGAGGGAGIEGVIAGGYEIWTIDGVNWVIYTVPNTDVPLGFQIRDESEYTALGSPAPTQTLTRQQANQRGLVDGGFATQLNNRAKHPFDAFVEDYEQAATMRPWLRDADVLAVVAEAILEGREVTEEELLATDWFSSRTPEEIAWLKDVGRFGDEWATQRINETRDAVVNELARNGTALPDAAIDLMATRWRTGEWSEAKFREQLRLATDPYAQGQMDFELYRSVIGQGNPTGGDRAAVRAGRDAVKQRVRQMFLNRGVPIATDTESEEARLERITSEVMAGTRDMADVRQSVDIIGAREGRPYAYDRAAIDAPRENEDRVRALVQKWLGPHFGGQYDEAWVREWAGRLRNDPDAEQELTDLLRGRRLAVLPEYTNENLTYQDIAGPWMAMYTQMWGRQADESDPMFHSILRMNDAAEASKLLRKEGLERGVGTVVNQAIGDAYRAFGGSTYRPVQI